MYDDERTEPVGPQPGGSRPAPDEVWAAVRRDYLMGRTARDCCLHHGVGMSALRERAARERWRRIDQPWVAPNPMHPHDEGLVLEERVKGDLDRIELHELGFVAFRRMMRAVLRGDAAEALRWRRVRQAMDEDEHELCRLMVQQDTVRHQLAGLREAELAAEEDWPDSPDDPDSPESADSADSADSFFACPVPPGRPPSSEA